MSNIFNSYKFGEQSPQRNIPKFEDLILESNKAAMEYLRLGNFTMALNFLRQAEKILLQEYQANPNDNTYRLIGITLNNLGCYYKRTGKLKVSLRYLKKALQIEIYTLNDKTNIAGTHLNICAILSAMNLHAEAISHVKLALELLEMAKTQCNIEENAEDKDEKQRYSTILTTMIIAYYNFGTELEYVRDYENALQAFTKGFNIAMNEYGPSHPLANTLQQNISQLSLKKKEFDKRESIKKNHMLKNLEANKYIRAHPKTQNLELEDKRPIEKSLEYGYDGHRKMIPKSVMPPLNKRGNSTPKYLPPLNQSDKNPLGIRQDYGNANYQRPINRISREKKLGESEMNRSMISEDKKSYKNFNSGTRGKINQSFTVERTSQLDESSYQKVKDENSNEDQSFLNDLSRDGSNLLALGPSSKSKNSKKINTDSLNKELIENDTARSPSTDKLGKKVKISSFMDNSVAIVEREKQNNINELWNNIQKYRNNSSSKNIVGTNEVQSTKTSTKIIEKKELPQLIEMSPEKTMSDEQ